VELRQLVYFEAVARCGGFTRAGEELRIAQPAISAQVKALEAELGTALLRRTTRQVALTPAGELFLARTRTVLAELDLARAELDELGEVLRGRVRIGATPVLGAIDLPGEMAAFHRAHPKVALSLRIGLVAELRDPLDADELDLVLAPADSGLEDYVLCTLAEERLVLITARGCDGGPDHAVEDLAEVREEPFVCLPGGSGLQSMLKAAASTAGFTPQIAFEASNPTAVRELVSAGLGVALLAESAARAPGPPVDVHRLAQVPDHPPICALRPAGRPPTPVVRAFVAQISP
jgi:DNA-binding transcriptional LysR family regulator